jgi:hypothetical protein
VASIGWGDPEDGKTIDHEANCKPPDKDRDPGDGLIKPGLHGPLSFDDRLARVIVGDI